MSVKQTPAMTLQKEKNIGYWRTRVYSFICLASGTETPLGVSMRNLD